MAVRSGRSMTAALEDIDPTLRPGVQALGFHTLRWLGRAEALRQQLATRPPPPEADALLCVALALGWREEGAPYAAHALVDQAVEAAKRSKDTLHQASFINGCLRRFLRERDSLVALTEKNPQAVWNHPQWWIDRVRKDHPTQWQAILQANNTRAPLTLRINERKTTQAQYIQVLSAINIVASPVGRQGVILVNALPVSSLPGFADGHFSVQDAAAQMAALLLLEGRRTQAPTLATSCAALPPKGAELAWGGPALRSTAPTLATSCAALPPEGAELVWGGPAVEPRPAPAARLRILDACAAPGGKTAHLLELTDCEVTALDIDARRCERIGQNLQRLGLQADIRVGDAARPADWWDGRPYDAILLDAPCTASGIVRRHPDVRWLRRPTDIPQLAALQARLFSALWPLLKPGGRLLYCTCSVFRAEGEQQAQTFVTHHTDAHLMPSPGHLLPQSGAAETVFPDNLKGDHDGFYYAVFEKRHA